MATLNTVTSSTRPASPAAGEAYFETDTNKIIVWTGSEWTEIVSDTAPSFSNTYSVDLDGTNDYMSLPQGTFNIGSGLWTYSMWFTTDVTPSYNGLFNLNGSQNLQSSCYFTNATTIRVTDVNNINLNVNVGSVALNTWHHLLVTKYTNTGGSYAKLYFNGVLKGDGKYANITDFGTENRAHSIGRVDYNNGYYLNGKVDEIGFWNSSLSDGSVSTGQTAGGDVADIYNSGVPGDISSLSPVGWWRMGDNDSGTGTTITDQGSGGNDGTLTNGPTFSTDVPS